MVKAKWTLSTYVQNFDYTGSVQTFTAPYTGYYKLEVWGAQGGHNISTPGSSGGYGGYSIGIIQSNSFQSLYVQVGGDVGSVSNNDLLLETSGYNGGGVGTPGGGGATSITTTNRGELSKYESYKSDVLIVAGGGGGDDSTCVAGSGGGYQGGDSSYNNEAGTPCRTDMTLDDSHLAFGGTQSAGGIGYTNGAFGSGGSLLDYSNAGHTDLGGGGGGGWYGGGSGGITRPAFGTGGGGSGYIGATNLLSALGVTKHMYCYNCGTTQTNNSYRTTVGLNHTNAATADFAKEGSGYARITWMGDRL